MVNYEDLMASEYYRIFQAMEKVVDNNMGTCRYLNWRTFLLVLLDRTSLISSTVVQNFNKFVTKDKYIYKKIYFDHYLYLFGKIPMCGYFTLLSNLQN